MKRLLAALTLCLGLTAQAQTLPLKNWVKPTDKHIQYVGRISFQNPESPVFTFPGVQINTGFTGTSIRMVAKPMSGYFMAQVDGCDPFKVSFRAPKDSVVTLAVALPQGEHQLKLMYVIEGYEFRPEFRGFVLDEGAHLTDAPALPQRKIEFVGNSITCGYGVEVSDASFPFEYETENHYYTYAALTARNLNAQHVAVARSGIGVYRNYGGKKEGDENNMNDCYGQTLLYDTTCPWDFSRFTPDVVCVNLGTNDTSTQPYDTRLLYQGYEKLYRQIRSHYPSAKLVFLTGSLLNGEALKDVKDALDKLVKETQKAGEKEIYRFDFTPADGSLLYGASWHPSYWQQEKMAGELTAYLRSLMKWY